MKPVPAAFVDKLPPDLVKIAQTAKQVARRHASAAGDDDPDKRTFEIFNSMFHNGLDLARRSGDWQFNKGDRKLLKGVKFALNEENRNEISRISYEKGLLRRDVTAAAIRHMLIDFTFDLTADINNH